MPDDEELAERVSYTWAGLSRACHQHLYELPPTSSELLAWIATVEQLTSRVQSIYVQVSRDPMIQRSNPTNGGMTLRSMLTWRTVGV
jgi:hypothetical protein